MTMFNFKFDHWMAEVNRHLDRLAGVHSDDLPDCCYADWFEDGIKPETAAKRALRSANE